MGSRATGVYCGFVASHLEKVMDRGKDTISYRAQRMPAEGLQA